MIPTSAPRPDLLAEAIEDERLTEAEYAARPTPEDPPLINSDNAAIWLALSQSASAIVETREILARLGHGH